MSDLDWSLPVFTYAKPKASVSQQPLRYERCVCGSVAAAAWLNRRGDR